MGAEQREGFDLQRHEPVCGQRLGHIETQPQRRQVKSGWFDAVSIDLRAQQMFGESLQHHGVVLNSTLDQGASDTGLGRVLQHHVNVGVADTSGQV